MAKSLLKATKKKTVKRADPIMMHEMHVGEEPVWDFDRAMTFSDDEYDHHLRASWKYYNYFYSHKDMKKHAVNWAKTNMKLTKEQMSNYIMSSPELTPMTVSGMAKAVTKGLPLREKHRQYMIDTIMRLANVKANAPVDEVVAPKQQAAPSIQDRIAMKTSEIIGEIEGEVDNAFKNVASDFKTFDFLTAKLFAQSQVSKVRDHFQKQMDELADFVTGKDKQLVEGYSHLKKEDLKRVNQFYTDLMADLDSYSQVKKAVRKARAPKAVNKTKLVSRVKYAAEDKALKLVSVNPVEIIGATEVWVYYTKARKLGRYVADDHAGSMGIKGTSIVGFDTAKSVSKTLRKPADTLKEFAKTGKVGLRTFLGNIKAVEARLNGRLNADVIILKVV